MLDYSKESLNDILHQCEFAILTTVANEGCACDILLTTYPTLFNNTGHVFIRSDEQWGCLFEGPEKELVTGNSRDHLWLLKESVHDFIVESEILLKGLAIPIPSFDGSAPQVNICPDNSSKLISLLLGALGESQSDDNKCKKHLTDDLVGNFRSTLRSLGLHGGVWDKRLTKMHAICGMLKDEKMISTILEGSRFKLWGYASSNLGAERAVVELLIEVARDLHCEGFCQKA